MTERQGRIRKQDLDDLKEKRMHWKHQFVQCGEIALADAMICHKTDYVMMMMMMIYYIVTM